MTVFSPAGHEVRQVVVAVLEVALVVHAPGCARAVSSSTSSERQRALDGVGHAVVGRGGEREHRGRLARRGQPLHGCADGGVGHALARLGQADVVRLVHHDEAHAARGRELVGVARRNSGVVSTMSRCRRPGPRSAWRRSSGVLSPVRRPRRYRSAPAPRAGGTPGRRSARAAGTRTGWPVARAARASAACTWKQQRLAAPRGHDGQRGAARRAGVEDLALRACSGRRR